jgi:hypothetical protein
MFMVSITLTPAPSVTANYCVILYKHCCCTYNPTLLNITNEPVTLCFCNLTCATRPLVPRVLTQSEMCDDNNRGPHDDHMIEAAAEIESPSHN